MGFTSAAFTESSFQTMTKVRQFSTESNCACGVQGRVHIAALRFSGREVQAERASLSRFAGRRDISTRGLHDR
jgi:hypothetical protein